MSGLLTGDAFTARFPEIDTTSTGHGSSSLQGTVYVSESTQGFTYTNYLFCYSVAIYEIVRRELTFCQMRLIQTGLLRGSNHLLNFG